MSENGSKKSGIFGAFGLPGLVGTIVSLVDTSSFVGWAGLGKALLVGAGTAMGASLLGAAGIIAGGIVFGAVGLLGGKKSAAVMACVGAAAGGITGMVAGSVKGYNFAENSQTRQSCKLTTQTANAVKTQFNITSKDGSKSAIVTLPQNTSKVQLSCS